MTLNREQRRAQERATRSANGAGSPEAAAEIDQLRRVRQGSYALMHVLVSRMGGGPIEVKRGEWQALPPKETLKVKVDPGTNDVTLFIEHEE